MFSQYLNPLLTQLNILSKDQIPKADGKPPAPNRNPLDLFKLHIGRQNQIDVLIDESSQNWCVCGVRVEESAREGEWEDVPTAWTGVGGRSADPEEGIGAGAIVGERFDSEVQDDVKKFKIDLYCMKLKYLYLR